MMKALTTGLRIELLKEQPQVSEKIGWNGCSKQLRLAVADMNRLN